MLLITILIILAATCHSAMPYTPTNDIVKRNHTSAYYWCPKKFIRVHNSCFYLSKKKETWSEASFRCRDIKNSTLAVLDDKFKDKYMRIMLNRSEYARKERWIGGMFNWEMKFWVWGPNGKPFQYKGFSKLRPNSNNRWRCVVMVPSMFNRWSTRSCLEKKHFICEVPMKMKWARTSPSLNDTVRNNPERRRKPLRRNRDRTRWSIETNSTL